MADEARSRPFVMCFTCGAEGETALTLVHSPGCPYWGTTRCDLKSPVDAKHDGRLGRPGKEPNTLETKRDEKAETESDAYATAIKSLAETIIDASINGLRRKWKTFDE